MLVVWNRMLHGRMKRILWSGRWIVTNVVKISQMVRKMQQNVMWYVQEDAILLGSSSESAEENMLPGEQLLLLVLKYFNFLQSNYIYILLFCVSTYYLYLRPKLVHFWVKDMQHSLVNLSWFWLFVWFYFWLTFLTFDHKRSWWR